MKPIIILLCLLSSQRGFNQCLISQGNMLLDYQVSQCNGYSFQSAIGATLSPFGDCADHSYVSVFTDGNTITKTNHLNQLHKIRMYPNPVHDRFILIISEPDLARVAEIINSLGTTLKIINLNKEQTQVWIDVSLLVNGIYFLKITSNTGQIKTISFTKSGF